MSEQSEPSISEYARFYGLTIDHLQPHPLQGITAPEDYLEQLEDTPGLFKIDEHNGTIPAERMFMDNETATFLAGIAPSSSETPSFDEDVDIDIYRFRNLKQELPLLRSDHESDMQEFACRTVPDLKNELLPLEPIDEEADEGLEWPEKYRELSDQIWCNIQSEKLVVPREALYYLQQTLKWHLEGGENTSFEDPDAEPTYEKTFDPVASPLLPMSPEALPFVPDSEVGHPDMLSDATSPINEEARKAETAISNQDAPLPSRRQASYSRSPYLDEMPQDSESLSDIYSPPKGIKDLLSSTPTIRTCVQDGKAEVSCLPTEAEQPTLLESKCDSFGGTLTESLPDLAPSTPALESNAQGSVKTSFVQDFSPVTVKAKAALEQEQPQNVHTISQVNVPNLDFARPNTPRDNNALEGEAKTNLDPCSENLDRLRSLNVRKYNWPLDDNVEWELQWKAFPSALAREGMQESVDDNGSAAEFSKQPECADSETLIWKPGHLRFLDQGVESGEKELEEGNPQEGEDLETLLRKRKLEMYDQDEDLSPPPRPRSGSSTSGRSHNGRALKAADSTSSSKGRKERHHSGNQREDPLSSTFSTLDAVGIFMGVRKGIFEAPKDIARANAPLIQPIGQQPDQTHRTAPDNHLQQDAADGPRPSLPAPFTPSPQIRLPKGSRNFIFSAGFLSNRKLARQVLALYPSAEIIERDWTMHSSGPNSSHLSTTNAIPASANSLSKEADIDLSPGVGLIWTTIQKTKQRSLPGQASHSALRDRVVSTARRYERLVVIVSQGLSDHDAGPIQLDQSDCDALVGFISFCSNLQDYIELVVIPNGNNKLAEWIASMMAKHSTPPWEAPIRLEETQSERFLREAGMNAFAAQAILSRFEPLDASPRNPDYSLSVFVKMSLQEKLREFKTYFGGSKLLNRVNQVLDSPS